MTVEQEGEGGKEGEAGGRALVRECFVQRLTDAGMVRPKGVSEAGYADMMGKLVDYLAYMGRENLITLAEVVLDHAEGPKRNVCPSEVLIRGMARGLQERPVMESRIVTSWLASIEGPSAEMGGYLVELLRFLRVHGRPPLAMDKRKIREEAADNQRTLGLAKRRVELETARDEDRAFIAAYEDDLRRAREIVVSGCSKRADGGKGQAA